MAVPVGDPSSAWRALRTSTSPPGASAGGGWCPALQAQLCHFQPRDPGPGASVSPYVALGAVMAAAVRRDGGIHAGRSAQSSAAGVVLNPSTRSEGCRLEDEALAPRLGCAPAPPHSPMSLTVTHRLLNAPSWGPSSPLGQAPACPPLRGLPQPSALARRDNMRVGFQATGAVLPPPLPGTATLLLGTGTGGEGVTEGPQAER